MQYISTRDSSRRYSAAQAIVQGLSRDGGLFLPETIPALTAEDLQSMVGMTYQQRAVKVMKAYLDEFTEEELAEYAAKAYAVPGKFDDAAVTPIHSTHHKTHFLELWHGPTCAFKDMALQILPHFLTTALKKVGRGKEAVILTATSGDTGKAALAGFQDVPGTRILVFYPRDGVSPMQKRQMATQEGENVSVCAIEGN